MRDYKKIYEEWLQSPYFDEDTKSELKAIASDEKEIKERFYTELEFGTAGLRGIIGAGTNRMNIYVVRKATQGLANYIKSLNIKGACVAIAYDSRNMSDVFSKEAALTLAANDIKAYRFTSLRPTPELSFAVRELKCIAGINITASHNPSSYNGYKVYWEDGAQFTPPHDKGVLKEVLAIEDYSKVKTMSEEEARAKGLYEDISSEIDDKYKVMSLDLNVVEKIHKTHKYMDIGYIMPFYFGDLLNADVDFFVVEDFSYREHLVWQALWANKKIYGMIEDAGEYFVIDIDKFLKEYGIDVFAGMSTWRDVPGSKMNEKTKMVINLLNI